MPSETRTARLTVLIDPRKKAVFEELCKDEDVTPSQVVRRLIRDYIQERLGPDWWDRVCTDEQTAAPQDAETRDAQTPPRA